MAGEVEPMTSAEFKGICIAAIDAAKVSRGKNRGMLKANCPKSDSDGAAAWQAMTLQANPYKAGIFTIAMFNDRQRAIFDAVGKAIEGYDVKHLDRDRQILEELGVW
jgi:hypothetical protein